MTRIRPIDQHTADAGAAELLSAVKKKMGSEAILILATSVGRRIKFQ